MNKCELWDEEHLLELVRTVTNRRAAMRAHLGHSPDARPRTQQLAEVCTLLQRDCHHGHWEYIRAAVVAAEGLSNCQLQPPCYRVR